MLGAVLALAGCSAPPVALRAVSVTLPGGPSVAPPSPRPGWSASLPSESYVLPRLEHAFPTRASVEDTWKRANRDQVDLLESEIALQSKEPLAAFRATRAADYAHEVEVRRSEQAAEVKAEMGQFGVAQQALADELGWKRTQLAWRVGFPDPDPKSARTPTRGDVFALRHWPEAAALRTEIQRRDAEFNAKWLRFLQQNQTTRDAELERMKVQRDHDLDLETGREAERLRSQANPDDVQVGFRPLPSLAPSQALSVGEVVVPRAVVGSSGVGKSGPPAGNWATKARLDIFLAQNNYRLAREGEPAHDATKEFRDWLRKYELGN